MQWPLNSVHSHSDLKISLTCDLNVKGGLVVSSRIFSLHIHTVNTWLLITVLNGFVCDSQIFINSPDPIH